MSAPLVFSLIVCTRNRRGQLRGLMCTLAENWAGRDLGGEVIVVDNGGHDDALDLARGFGGRMPVVCAAEPCVGLSHARNAGWRTARGEVCIYVDDDTRAPRGWLDAWLRGLRRWPVAAFYGGPITPVFQGAPPLWADPHNFPFLFGNFRPPLEEGPFPPSSVYLACGGNMAVRASFLREAGGFSPDLGLAGDRLLGSEETALFRMAQAQGRQGVYLPEAGILHWIEPGKKTLAYAWRRSKGQGATMARLSPRSGVGPPSAWRRFGPMLARQVAFLARRPSWPAFGRLFMTLALARGYQEELRRGPCPDTGDDAG